MKLATVALILLVLILFSFPTSAPVRTAKAQSQPVSTVWIDPVKTCCPIPGSSNSPVGIAVKANVTSDESFVGFDVKLNYTRVAPDGKINYTYSLYSNKVVNATRIDYSSGVFANGYVGFECIDGLLIIGSVCPADDAPSGQIHLFMLASGGYPVTGNDLVLFTVQFNVVGNGTVVFALDYVGLKNPGSNPNAPSIHDIQVIRIDGVFSNKGVVAFFNFRPANPPAILPNQVVIFDARGSFSAVSLTMNDVTSYRWNFGDGASSAGPLVTHGFGLPGRYEVQLNVTDQAGNKGSLTRLVVVVPALGGLDLQVKNQRGDVLRGNVKVQLFNSTILSSPFLNKTVDNSGGIVFQGLKPDSYVLKFSGPTIRNSSETENVIPGWTTQGTVYVFENLASTPPPPPDYSGIIFFGTILGGLSAITTVMVVKRRSPDGKALRQKQLSSLKSLRRTGGERS